MNLACLVSCDSDSSCLSQCSREFLTCVDNCPCFTNCYEVNPENQDSSGTGRTPQSLVRYPESPGDKDCTVSNNIAGIIFDFNTFSF